MRFESKRVAIAAAVLCLLMTTGFSRNPAARQDPSAGTTTIFLPLVVAPAVVAPTPKTVEILPNATSFVDSVGSLHIVGEVANHSANHLRNVEITANLFDSANQFVGTANTQTTLYSLPAGDHTCFELTMDPPAGWTSYSFGSPTYTTDGYPLPKITLIDQQGTYDPEFGWFDITGHVRNDSGKVVNNVSLVGTLYNAAMKVIACDYTFVNYDAVNRFSMTANQTRGFDLSFVKRDYSDIAFYRIQIDGEIQ